MGSVLQCMQPCNSLAVSLQQLISAQECSACPLPARIRAYTCSVLQRMLRRNPLAALSLQQPSLPTPSLQLADDMPFQLDKEGDADSPDGMCTHYLNLPLRGSPNTELMRNHQHDLMLCYSAMHMLHPLLLQLP